MFNDHFFGLNKFLPTSPTPADTGLVVSKGLIRLWSLCSSAPKASQCQPTKEFDPWEGLMTPSVAHSTSRCQKSDIDDNYSKSLQVAGNVRLEDTPRNRAAYHRP